MKKSITIHIPKPCHEDWAKMTTTEKGKHCAVCTKEVVDFTTKTDETIVKHISMNKNTCGRFTSKQLNRELTMERKSGTRFAPYAASLLLPLTLLNTAGVNANERASYSEKPFTSLGIGSHGNTERSQVTTTGIVRDSHGIPLSNVEIFVLETGYSVRTAADGSYTITCLNDETLIFQKRNFENKEIKLGRKNTTTNIELEVLLKTVTSVVGKIASYTVVQGDVVEEQREEATEITISGTIVDEYGIPLPGTNVIVKGTSTGTQSDFDGNYSIDVASHAVLVLSYVGYETKEITTSTISNVINIELTPNDMFLGEVIMGIMVMPEETGPSVGYAKPESNLGSTERQARKKKLKQAHDNEIEFKRIQKERKKKNRNR